MAVICRTCLLCRQVFLLDVNTESEYGLWNTVSIFSTMSVKGFDFFDGGHDLKIIDMHCDVLYKMLLDPTIQFMDGNALDVTYERLRSGGIGLQAFAIFLPEDRPPRFEMVEEAAELLHHSILSYPWMKMVKTRHDLLALEGSDEIGALLTLEGADGLMGSLEYLERAYELGVRCLGLTWNYANWAADGVLEPRQAGLSVKGRELVQACNEIGMIIDISHLNVPGFWEVMELTRGPVFASHSNAYEVTAHPRNLSDDQLQALFKSGGMVGLTFVPDFAGGDRSIRDIFRHLDHVCSLGGENFVGFGSDFDGIDEHLVDLTHPGHYENFVDQLLIHYSEEQTRKFLFDNWRQFLLNHLPEND